MDLKPMPFNLEAEQYLLGCIIIQDDILVDLIDILEPGDFYASKHQILYKVLIEMFTNSIKIEIVGLMNQLHIKQITDISMSYIADLFGSVCSVSNYRNYCKLIKDKSDFRKLIKLGYEITEIGYSEKEEINSVIDAMDSKLLSIKEIKATDIEGIESITVTGINRIEAFYKSGGGVRGYKTGYTKLDNTLCGLQKSDLIILAARPSMGKTAFALNLCINMAKENATVGIFSLEMSKDQLFDRLISAYSIIDYEKIKSGNLKDEDWVKLSKFAAHLADKKIFIDDDGYMSISKIRARAKKMKLKNGLDMLIIDYLQLIQAGKNSGNRNNEISEMTRGLKLLAKELNVPIICLSQLSRACEARGDKRPQLSDLRESGSIEQDADVVIFLYRDEYYYKDSMDKNISEVIISKNRNGKVGSTKLAWMGSYQKFGNLDIR